VRIIAIALGAAAAAVVLAGLGLFLWLRSYAPLGALAAKGTYAPGAGLGADVEPTLGSGGKTVYIPVYRTPRRFATKVTLHNGGHFAVTIKGLATRPGGALSAQSVSQLRLDPNQDAAVTVVWRLDCSDGNEHGEIAADRIRLRYRYLSMFTRTQTVALPYAVNLRCSGGPPASP
jgi:hypothetical protein